MIKLEQNQLVTNLKAPPISQTKTSQSLGGAVLYVWYNQTAGAHQCTYESRWRKFWCRHYTSWPARICSRLLLYKPLHPEELKVVYLRIGI